jgi:CTP synthase (UTP-ammonia lyase)
MTTSTSVPTSAGKATRPPRLALVGDRSPDVQAHARIPLLVEALQDGSGAAIELYWLHSTMVTKAADVAGFDGIWAVPGSPYQSEAGVLAAIEAARTNAIPFLGTCGGFQHLLLEFARNVCGLHKASNAEVDPSAEQLLIVPLECSLLGEEAAVTIVAGSAAAAAMGAGPSTERYFCRYGLAGGYLELLESYGLVVSGRDELGEARVVELPGHPFYVASLFQPELSSDPTWVHPLIAAFAAAVRGHAAASTSPDRSADTARTAEPPAPSLGAGAGRLALHGAQ